MILEFCDNSAFLLRDASTMRQKSFSGSFDKYRKQTRKEKFLNEMEQIVPWQEMVLMFAPSSTSHHCHIMDAVHARNVAFNSDLFRLFHLAFAATGELYDAFDLVKSINAPNKLVNKIPDFPERLKKE